MTGPEPFRCLACGSGSATATRCGRCGGRSFTLTHPRGHAVAIAPPRDNIVHLETRRDRPAASRRSRRRRR